MSNPFGGELAPFDVTVTATVREHGRDGWTLSATLENGTEAEGGEVELYVTDAARAAFGLNRCVDEFELWVNSTLRPEYRLDAALAMGAHGPFAVVSGPANQPYIVIPPERGSALAA
jgi:hypothetical protein